jgi:hypothetical protein
VSGGAGFGRLVTFRRDADLSVALLLVHVALIIYFQSNEDGAFKSLLYSQTSSLNSPFGSKTRLPLTSAGDVESPAAPTVISPSDEERYCMSPKLRDKVLLQQRLLDKQVLNERLRPPMAPLALPLLYPQNLTVYDTPAFFSHMIGSWRTECCRWGQLARASLDFGRSFVYRIALYTMFFGAFVGFSVAFLFVLLYISPPVRTSWHAMASNCLLCVSL